MTADGTIMKGVVVDRVTPDMTLFRQESFGPQVSITRATSSDEAIALANDTEYGLAAALFTRDLARGLELARRIDSGICHINGPTVHDEAQMPFGGMKASGYGRFGGKAASTRSPSCVGSPCRRPAALPILTWNVSTTSSSTGRIGVPSD